MGELHREIKVATLGYVLTIRGEVPYRVYFLKVKRAEFDAPSVKDMMAEIERHEEALATLRAEIAQGDETGGAQAG
ncbi:hypothetical protein ES703_20309 [subsurface metagenome]